MKKAFLAVLLIITAIPLTAKAVSEKDCKLFSKEISKVIRKNRTVPKKPFDWWKQKPITEELKKNHFNVIGYYPPGN